MMDDHAPHGFAVVADVIREAERPITMAEIVARGGYSHEHSGRGVAALRETTTVYRILKGQKGRGGAVAYYTLSSEAAVIFAAEVKREALATARSGIGAPYMDAIRRAMHSADVGLSGEEIAALTGYSRSTVRTCVYQMRAAGETVYSIRIPRPGHHSRHVYTTCPGIAAMERNCARDELEAQSLSIPT